uniref:AAA domain-containing protein n=1 Tax=Syphacia muris TaxID=451379 RepID=A0A0N5AV82_9BILA
MSLRIVSELYVQKDADCQVSATETSCAAEVYSRFRKRTPKFYKDTLRAPVVKKNFEFIHSPVPPHVKPILSATQRSARMLTKKARCFKKKSKNVRFIAKPIRVVEITPRPEKKLGVVAMPESPPFPYSRTTFFNLLVRESLVDFNHPMRKQYITGDAQLIDLGLCPDMAEKMRHYAETENHKDNFETFDVDLKDINSECPCETSTVQKRAKACKRRIVKAKEVAVLQETTISNVNNKSVCKGLTATHVDVASETPIIPISSRTTPKKRKCRATGVRHGKSGNNNANVSQTTTTLPMVLDNLNNKDGSKVDADEVTIIDEDGSVTPSTSASCTSDFVTNSDSWQESHERLIFKEVDNVPFSSICHIGGVVSSPSEINFSLLTKKVCGNSWKTCASTYFSSISLYRQKEKENGDCRDKKLEELHLNSVESTQIVELPFYKPCSDDWCTQLKPRTSSQCLGNITVVNELRDWLLVWKKKIERLNCKEEKSKEKTKTQKRGKRRRSESDEDYITEDEVEPCNTFVVCGPTGCGKTAMIEVIADELSMAAIVSSNNEKRNSANLRAKFEGALESQRFEVSKYDIRKMFSPKHNECDNGNSKKKDGQLCTIIVIDDVDICFADSNSFWSSLKSVCASARIPIIMTCEDGNYVKNKLNKDPKVDYIFAQVNKQSVVEIEQYIYTNFTNLFPNQKCLSTLTSNVELLNCNLRSSINLVHFFGSSLPDQAALQPDLTSDFLQSIPKNSLFLSSLCVDGEKSELGNSLKKMLISECSAVAMKTKAAYECVKTVQNDYLGPNFYSLRQISTELLPLLKMIDDTSRSEASGNRRILHHFDRFEMSLDPHGSIRRALSDYKFPKLLYS